MKKRIMMLTVAAMTILMMVVMTACGSSEEASDWAYIEEKGTLVIGLDDTFAPMGFRDEDNNLVGFDIDLANAVGEKLGVEVEFQPVDWEAKEAELEAKNIDCIWNGLSVTPDRLESMTMSNKYLDNKILVMSLDESINIKSEADLVNYNIGVQSDSSAQDLVLAASNYEDFADNVSEYPTYDEAILDMKAGRIDVIAIDEVYAFYNNQNKEQMYASDFNFGADYYAVGFRKGDEELAAKVNDAIGELIDDGTAEEISNKWFKQNLVINEPNE